MGGPDMRKPLALSLTLLGSAALAVSCSSTPPDEHPTVQTSATATASVAQPPAIDLSPVTAPANLVVTYHAKDLSGPFAMVGVKTDDALRMILHEGLGKHGLKLDVDPDKIAALIAPEAPVDALVALSDQSDPFIAVAVGLHALDDAKTAFNATTELKPGMWQVPGARSTCVVAAATGLVPARLICGPGQRDIEALGPYLARGASSLPTTPDGALDIDLAPVNAKFGADLKRLIPLAPRFALSQLGLGNPQFDKALETAAEGLATEGVAYVGDLQHIRMNLTFSTTAGFSMDGTVTLKPDATSWIAKTASHTTNVAAPDMFLREPADAASATWSSFHDPADYEGIKRVGKDLVEGVLAKFNVGNEAERKKVSALLDFPFVKDMVFVTAGGFGHVTKVVDPKTDNQKFLAFMDGQTGWRLFGTSAKPDTVTKWLRDAVAAYSQPGIQKEIARVQKDGVPLPAVSTPPPPAKLGKGAFELDVQIKVTGDKAKDKNAKPPTTIAMTLFVLVMADGDQSWIAFGFDKDRLVERLAMVKAGAPKDKQLGSRADVASLAQGSHASQGFMTLESFRGLASSFFLMRSVDAGSGGKAPFDELLGAEKKLDDMIAALPNKAATPIAFQVTQSQPNVGTFSFTIPKGTLADVSNVLQFFGTRRASEPSDRKGGQ